MDRKFDLRLQADREALAASLPSFDGRTINIPPTIFVEALRDVSNFLGNPEWLTYQWGTVGPFSNGNSQNPVELSRITELGLELRDLSRHENFDALLAQFANPSQFFDTLFEIRVASLFSRFKSTTHMRFAPPYAIRHHEKHPEFDVCNDLGVFTIECKQPHMFVQRATQTFQATADAIYEVLKAIDWPHDLRLEVEILGPPQEHPESFAKSLVDLAVNAIQTGSREFVCGTAQAFVVPRKSPFRINDVKFGRDVLIIDDEPTGLFNPNKTMLRVANNGLDHKFARSTGARIAEALRQLPADHYGIIVLGGMPRRIADAAIARRIEDRAYDKVFAFIIHEDEQFHFNYRTKRREDIQQLLSPGIRPLYSVS
jgi:hypothetical protein